MKIEVWSDFVCPFCYIGKRQLELALEKFPYKDHVLIEYKSFEIYPNSSSNKVRKLSDVLIERYNISSNSFQTINDQAKEVEISYKLDMLMHVNTFDAHRLLKYACTQDKEKETIERLLKGYFINKEKIDDIDILLRLCDELSFNKEEVCTLLKSGKFSRAVRCDQIEAEEIGIEQIPFFLFNEEFAISGVQSVEVFKEALEVTWDLMGGKPLFSLKQSKKSKASYCTGDNCKE